MPCMLIFRLTECLALRGDRRGKRVSAPLVKLLFYFFWTTEPKPPSPPIKVESFGDPPIVGGNRPVPSALICIRYTFCSCCHMFFFPPSTINNNKSRQRGLTRCLHPPRKGSSGLLIEKRPEVESLEDTPVPSVVWFFFFLLYPTERAPLPFQVLHLLSIEFHVFDGIHLFCRARLLHVRRLGVASVFFSPTKQRRFVLVEKKKRFFVFFLS